MSTSPISPEVQEIVTKCFAYAKEHSHEALTPEHMLLILLDYPRAQDVFEAVRGNTAEMRKYLVEYLDQQVPKTESPSDEVGPTTNFQKLIHNALFQIKASGQKKEASIDELLIAFFNLKDSYALNLLKNQEISRLDVVNYITHGLRKGEETPAMQAAEDEQSNEDSKNQNALAQFTMNLNKRALEGKIDPLVGRDLEVERVIQILCRRRKNNPILVGDPGVGKTAIAEGLAKRITEGTVPAILKNCEVLSLDLGALVAGTKYRGDFETRIKGVIKEVSDNPNRILFVDEIHTLIGAGAASGGNMDASNLLKPALSRGDLRCIGATTFKEFRGIFEADHALSRRFQKVDINEPSIEDTIEVLKGTKARYEEHHGVTYTEEALEAAARLSARYINDRLLPDKALDVIDEAGALQRTLPEDKAAKTITPAEIEKVIAKIANVPVGTVSESDKHKIKHLNQDLNEVVFAQEAATTAVSRSVLLNRSGLGKANKPVGSYLFTGPTGVGKTELTKQLAKTLGMDLIRFDMSEFMEKQSVARFIGAPPGYVGHDEGGQLIEAINKKPHCVLLLDEIEKAHPDVFNSLLQVMDNATLTDGKGRKADFRNVILIMTTNVGAALAAGKRSIGFSANPDSASKDASDSALKSTFTPEFRNRLDKIIQFNPIDDVTIRKIVDKNLSALDLELRQRKPPVSITFTENLREALAKKGFDPANGARPLERLIQETVKLQIAEELMYGRLENGGSVELDGRIENDELVVTHVIGNDAEPAPARKTRAKAR